METTTELPDKLGKLFQSSREYLESKVELEVLKGTDKIAQAMSLITVYVVALVLGMLLLIFLGAGFAVLINTALGSTFLGYFLIAGVFLLVLVLVFFVVKSGIKKAVINAILNNIDNE